MISSSMLILSYTIQQVIPNICTKFQNPRHSIPEKSLTQISLCITLEWEMEKWKKMVKINLIILVFCPTIYLATPRCIRNLKTLALIETEKSVTENLLGEKEKWTNKGNGKHQEADSLLHNARRHTQHLHQISKSWVQLFQRNLWHKFPYVLHWSERWKKRKMEKEGKNKSQHLDFLSHNILGHSQGVYKIWRLWLS